MRSWKNSIADIQCRNWNVKPHDVEKLESHTFIFRLGTALIHKQQCGISKEYMNQLNESTDKTWRWKWYESTVSCGRWTNSLTKARFIKISAGCVSFSNFCAVFGVLLILICFWKNKKVYTLTSDGSSNTT